MKKPHRHYISAIETDNPLDPYGGIRIMVTHDRDDTKTDAKDWIEDELGETFETVEAAISAYKAKTGRKVVLEEHDA